MLSKIAFQIIFDSQTVGAEPILCARTRLIPTSSCEGSTCALVFLPDQMLILCKFPHHASLHNASPPIRSCNLETQQNVVAYSIESFQKTLRK